jgi:dolichol kinase
VSSSLSIWILRAYTCVELKGLALLIASLVLLYIPRLILWTYRHRKPTTWFPVKFPATFDPAPVIYPPSITIYVSLLISVDNPGVILPNIVLSICSIPSALIPSPSSYEFFNPVHWVLTCLPLLSSGGGLASPDEILKSGQLGSNYRSISPDTAEYLYPLHQSLCQVLHYLTTTSLEPAELQLLSIALINLLLLSASPQMQILKVLLWGGGLGLQVLTGQVIRWGIALARVPKWRFRRVLEQTKPRTFLEWLKNLIPLRRIRQELLWPRAVDETASETVASEDEKETPQFKRMIRVRTIGLDGIGRTENDRGPYSAISPMSPSEESASGFSSGRRNTFPGIGQPIRRSKTHTPSGRKKRSTSMSVRAFFKLTQGQATARKWTYAVYVYTCILGIGLVGIRQYIQKYALAGNEPIGWALGYLFGDLPRFRFKVVSHNLERWICLPPRTGDEDAESCHMGWVEHVRRADFGEANTRLFLSAYWLMILVFGLVVVVRLTERYEVDTRRKVFHFMMVAMFLPGTFVDPTYAAMALSLILAIFLLLDLLRASQLPPLSKPLATFLAPYVDGRDFRGPVVISHIFLLIGCAIPLWLTLASLPRTGTAFLVGWEVPTREVSMVSGVICVGLGDSAASLIGRRYGHRKWLWGGGKSLEGSLAFAVAVFAGLAAANAWLRIGGWPIAGPDVSPGVSLRNTGICASMASLTEAVLTGGNDNVIVPVVLWACVKSLGV